MKSGKSEWCQEVSFIEVKEISLLQELIPLFNSKKWKNISKIFKERGFERSETECREKWVNFFNPKIKNSDWSKNELEILYESYLKHKTQWYMIEKMLPGREKLLNLRTQNKIKNRFYGTIRNFVRFIVRFFNKEAKSYSTEINRLSPKYLNMIYESEEGFEFMRGELPKVIKDLGYLFDRSQFSKKVKENKEIYCKLFKELIGIFNSNTNEDEELENSESEGLSENEQIEKNEFENQNPLIFPQNYYPSPYMFPNYFLFYPNYLQ